MGWIRGKQHTGTLGAGFYDGGVTLVLLEPADAGGNRRLAACESLRASDAGALGDAVKSWVQSHRAAGARCIAVLEPAAYQLLHIEPPQVPAEEMATALRWRIKDLLHYPAEEAVVDVFPVPQPVRERVRDHNVVVARESLVRERIGLLEQAGLALESIDIGELAQRNVAASLPHNAEGLALLTLDADSGLITLVRQDEVYLARDLDFGLDALPPGLDAPLDDPAFERITLELQRSLDYYESALGQAPLNRILVFPGGPRSQALIAALQSNFAQARVHELLLDDLLESDESLADALVELPAGVLAVGAALRAPEAAA